MNHFHFDLYPKWLNYFLNEHDQNRIKAMREKKPLTRFSKNFFTKFGCFGFQVNATQARPCLDSISSKENNSSLSILSQKNLFFLDSMDPIDLLH